VELVPDPLAQINDPPADHAVHGRDRSALDHRRQRRPVPGVETRRLAGCLAIDQPLRAVRVEPQHPVAHNLQCHAANRRRLRAARSVIDRGQRQQAAHLLGIPALARRPAHACRVKIRPQRDWHGETPSFASLQADRGRVGESPTSRDHQVLV